MSLPPWLEPLLDAGEMRATDAWAIQDRGIPSLDLMERAGRGLADVVARVAPSGRVAIVCGKGGNGGDGLVAARVLRAAGREVDVMLVWGPGDLSPDARTMWERLDDGAGEGLDPEKLASASVVVDALLGTGSSGAPRGRVEEAIAAMAAAGVPAVAADIPSGVDASTGAVAGAAVRAAATATFHAGKVGLWVHPGKAHAGAVEVVDIGIPAGAPAGASAGLIGSGATRGLAGRDAASTKFRSGVVAVLGGSRGLTGAPSLAAAGAMRAGAGYVTIAGPAELEVPLAVRAPVEAMFKPLPGRDGALVPEAVEAASEAVARAGAVVLGPGAGRTPGALEFARRAYAGLDRPLVVDADGLNALAELPPDGWPARAAPTVLTPHAGELARLLRTSSEEVGARRLESARAAAEATGAVVVLKGDDTLVAEPGGWTAVSPGGAPGLATAGTGDVLAGVIAALIARGLPPAQAACAGVRVHAAAGRAAAARSGPDTVIASDVVAALPAALREG